MPNGKTHDIITAVSTPLVYLGSNNIFHHDQKINVIITVAFLFSSLMFNGDLDIDSRPYRRWSVLRFIWLPYRNIFEHRSIWTHGIIIGTIIRIIYISPIILFIVLKFNIDFIIYLYVLLGLELGNSIHTLSDKIGSKFT